MSVNKYVNLQDNEFRTNYEVLVEVYERLTKNPNDKLKGLEVYHSNVGYIHSLVTSMWPDRGLSYKDVARMMVEEGMTLQDRPVKMKDLVTKL